MRSGAANRGHTWTVAANESQPVVSLPSIGGVRHELRNPGRGTHVRHVRRHSANAYQAYANGSLVNLLRDTAAGMTSAEK
jgi:hypothetical protein